MKKEELSLSKREPFKKTDTTTPHLSLADHKATLLNNTEITENKKVEQENTQNSTTIVSAKKEETAENTGALHRFFQGTKETLKEMGEILWRIATSTDDSGGPQPL
jgi:hypothetical protein